MSYKVFIDGEAGTTGLEIKGRLTQMKGIQLLQIDSQLRKDNNARLEKFNEADIVFLCLPDNESKKIVEIASSHTRIIDASTAHRTDNDWVYGLPEQGQNHKSKIQKSNRVANPGCHATGAILLLKPLIANGIIDNSELINIHSITGYSGGGKSMIERYKYNRVESDVEIKAPRLYGLSQEHKHLPEIMNITGLKYAPTFCPVVADFYRGMLVNIPIHKTQINNNKYLNELTPKGLTQFFSSIYTNQRCIKVVDQDQKNENKDKFITKDGFIAANSMAGRDDVIISVIGNEDRMNLIALYDNLGKGASGAAIQNMNIMLGLPEYGGLNIYG